MVSVPGGNARKSPRGPEGELDGYAGLMVRRLRLDTRLLQHLKLQLQRRNSSVDMQSSLRLTAQRLEGITLGLGLILKISVTLGELVDKAQRVSGWVVLYTRAPWPLASQCMPPPQQSTSLEGN